MHVEENLFRCLLAKADCSAVQVVPSEVAAANRSANLNLISNFGKDAKLCVVDKGKAPVMENASAIVKVKEGKDREPVGSPGNSKDVVIVIDD